MRVRPVSARRVTRVAKRKVAWSALGALGGALFSTAGLIVMAVLAIVVLIGGGITNSGGRGAVDPQNPCAGQVIAQPAAATSGDTAAGATDGSQVHLPKPGPYSGAKGEQAKPGVTAGPIPENMLKLYRAAAAKYGLPDTLLAAIGWEEMKHGVVKHDSSAGAQGPMQFMPDTWKAYGVDGNGDGKADPYNTDDSVFAAANYLVASGVKGGTEEAVKKAIFAYNHADWYVNDILVWAEQYGGGYVTTGAIDPAADCPPASGAPAPSGGSGSVVLPTTGRYTSCFCNRWGSYHYGIDLAAPIGTPIYAAADGVVVRAGTAEGFGLWVVLQHPGLTNVYTVYGHVNSFSVSVGQQVTAGQQIAEVGNRGYSTGPHLHFEVQTGPGVTQGKIDPEPWLTEHGVTLPPYQG